LTGQESKSLWKNEYFQTIVTIVVVIGIVVGFWFGLRWGLNTDYPVLAVASGSMSIAQPDPGWASPFSPTLHTGDLILVEGVSASDIHPGPPPNGTVLVFHNSDNYDELIVHRAVSEITINGTLYFITAGDGNGGARGPPTNNVPIDPQTHEPIYGAVPFQYVVGKVVMRVPWLGYVALDIRNSTAILIVVVLIIAFIIIESVVSEVEHKRTGKSENPPKENVPGPKNTP
jgi:signal peptidase I